MCMKLTNHMDTYLAGGRKPFSQVNSGKFEQAKRGVSLASVDLMNIPPHSYLLKRTFLFHRRVLLVRF